jgi:flagellar biosynthesis/type III secretory pathway protein FliH
MTQRHTMTALALAAALLGLLAWRARHERRRLETELARAAAAAAEAYRQGHADGLSDGYARARREGRRERMLDYLAGYDEALADMEEARELGDVA